MIPHIFIDYNGTLDRDDSYMLLEKTDELSGSLNILATDAKQGEANSWFKNLVNTGHHFDGFVSYDTFSIGKMASGYWPMVLKEFKCNYEQIIFIDDNELNLKRAQHLGIVTISPENMNLAISELDSAYNKIINLKIT